ncbi:DDE_3 domain-containing protein [Trichonephila clavipes]|nr:DDE_3 domain-containing protein [Trichonephila clavipes]
MSDLLDFQRSHIVEVHLVRLSVTEASQLLGFARRRMWKVMRAYIQRGKTRLVKQNSGRKEKLIERDRRDDSASSHAAGLVQSWFNEHDDEIKHLPWPAQSHNIIIIQLLWSTAEYSKQNRYTPPTSLPELSQHLNEELYKIPLNTIQQM